MTDFPSLIESYLSGPRTLRQAVTGMTVEQVRARPVPGKWSTLEVVCHLSDFEPILAERMKRVLAEDSPLLMAADENRFAAILAYHDRDLEEELDLIERTRAQMARILRMVSPSALERVGVHSQRGLLSLEQILGGTIKHIPHHVRFLADKRKALGLPA